MQSDLQLLHDMTPTQSVRCSTSFEHWVNANNFASTAMVEQSAQIRGGDGAEQGPSGSVAATGLSKCSAKVSGSDSGVLATTPAAAPTPASGTAVAAAGAPAISFSWDTPFLAAASPVDMQSDVVAPAVTVSQFTCRPLRSVVLQSRRKPCTVPADWRIRAPLAARPVTPQIGGIQICAHRCQVRCASSSCCARQLDPCFHFRRPDSSRRP